MKKDWVLSQDAFDAMLTWLSPDRQSAAEKYEVIRLRLIKIFICNHCAEAEELADETINRVASKVPEIRKEWKGDPALCFYGYAQNIFFEWRRRAMRQVRVEDAPNLATAVSDAADNDDDREHECLELCMKERPENERTLLLGYFREQGQAKIEHHKALAVEMGITVNALRIRVHRILRRVRKCVIPCLEAGPAN